MTEERHEESAADGVFEEASPADIVPNGCPYLGMNWPAGSEVCMEITPGNRVMAVCSEKPPGNFRWKLLGNPC